MGKGKLTKRNSNNEFIAVADGAPLKRNPKKNSSGLKQRKRDDRKYDNLARELCNRR